jgi:hypothetical protein
MAPGEGELVSGMICPVICKAAARRRWVPGAVKRHFVGQTRGAVNFFRHNIFFNHGIALRCTCYFRRSVIKLQICGLRIVEQFAI